MPAAFTQRGYSTLPSQCRGPTGGSQRQHSPEQVSLSDHSVTDENVTSDDRNLAVDSRGRIFVWPRSILIDVGPRTMPTRFIEESSRYWSRELNSSHEPVSLIQPPEQVLWPSRLPRLSAVREACLGLVSRKGCSLKHAASQLKLVCTISSSSEPTPIREFSCQQALKAFFSAPHWSSCEIYPGCCSVVCSGLRRGVA